MGFSDTEAFAQELDALDELAPFRDEFVSNDPDTLYLDGNSLGRLPKRTVARLNQVVVDEWGGRLVRGWNEGWYTAPERIGAKIARLIGAEPDEVIVADSTSVDLFKLVTAALQLQRGRTTIVSDQMNFPSDLYILQGVIRLLNESFRLDLVESVDGVGISEEQLARAITPETALVALSHVAFKSGFLYPMAEITRLAHGAGALILWDLCHSAGVIPINLDRDNVDLAVGCSYKYLNAGPGAPAFLFIRRELQEGLINPISGWFGQTNQFGFDLEYRPSHGIKRFLSGTPPILSLSAVEPAIDMIVEAGVDRLRTKSVRMTEYLVYLWQAWLEPFGVRLNSPRDSNKRGSHISVGHPEAYRIDRALIDEMKVIPDFRRPDNIRLGVAPMYTSFKEIHQAMLRFRKVLAERVFEKYSVAGQEVT